MRNFLFTLVVAVGFLAMPISHHAIAAAGAPVASISQAAPAADQQTPPPQVTVQVQHQGGQWYVRPIWIVVGVIGLIVLVMLIVMAARGGGGTTVVKG